MMAVGGKKVDMLFLFEGVEQILSDRGRNMSTQVLYHGFGIRGYRHVVLAAGSMDTHFNASAAAAGLITPYSLRASVDEQSLRRLLNKSEFYRVLRPVQHYL
jgi:hypothetical protein